MLLHWKFTKALQNKVWFPPSRRASVPVSGRFGYLPLKMYDKSYGSRSWAWSCHSDLGAHVITDVYTLLKIKLSMWDIFPQLYWAKIDKQILYIKKAIIFAYVYTYLFILAYIIYFHKFAYIQCEILIHVYIVMWSPPSSITSHSYPFFCVRWEHFISTLSKF